MTVMPTMMATVTMAILPMAIRAPDISLPCASPSRAGRDTHFAHALCTTAMIAHVTHAISVTPKMIPPMPNLTTAYPLRVMTREKRQPHGRARYGA